MGPRRDSSSKQGPLGPYAEAARKRSRRLVAQHTNLSSATHTGERVEMSPSLERSTTKMLFRQGQSRSSAAVGLALSLAGRDFNRHEIVEHNRASRCARVARDVRTKITVHRPASGRTCRSVCCEVEQLVRVRRGATSTSADDLESNGAATQVDGRATVKGGNGQIFNGLLRAESDGYGSIKPCPREEC